MNNVSDFMFFKGNTAVTTTFRYLKEKKSPPELKNCLCHLLAATCRHQQFAIASSESCITIIKILPTLYLNFQFTCIIRLTFRL